MKVNNSIISRDYIFTNKELRELLNIKGDIQGINLWKGAPGDKFEWEIVTHEDITKQELTSNTPKQTQPLKEEKN